VPTHKNRPDAARPPAASKRAISSRDLGIHLESRKEAEMFKWFQACLLFGKPIQQEVAKRAYLAQPWNSLLS
jgi:hypothetical protein